MVTGTNVQPSTGPITNHPESCRDPNCTLTYSQHLTFAISYKAIPNRTIHRTPGQPDEPAVNTHIRDKRWERDHEAFRRLTKQGYSPPQIDGSRFRERAAENEYDINHRPVTIDYKDPT